MVIDEIWSVSPERLRAFFDFQPDVTRLGAGYRFGTCRITLMPQESKSPFPWHIPRTRIRMEGDEADTNAIYRRFFLRFLSAGG